MTSNCWERDMLLSPNIANLEVACPSPSQISLESCFLFEDGDGYDLSQILPGEQRLKQDISEDHVTAKESRKQSTLIVRSECADDEQFSLGSYENLKDDQHEFQEIPMLSTEKINPQKFQPRRTRAQAARRATRKAKNLKRISSDLFELLLHHHSITYTSLCQKMGALPRNDKGEGRAQSNVKRRLYDAINVLRAIGFVHKHRAMEINEISLILDNNFEKKGISEKKDSIKEMEERIREKKKLLKKLKSRKLSRPQKGQKKIEGRQNNCQFDYERHDISLNYPVFVVQDFEEGQMNPEEVSLKGRIVHSRQGLSALNQSHFERLSSQMSD